MALFFAPALAGQRYPATGLVLNTDEAKKIMVVSCNEIPGFMDAMVMPLKVADTKSLAQLRRGASIEFTLVVNKDSSHAENIRVRQYASADREPSEAGRLQVLDKALRGQVGPLKVGDSVPDFALIDQEKRRVRLSQFTGKTVALNFVYTRCVLPEYCFRSSNNFGVLAKKYGARLGRDLVLLTVTFDPVHDQPEVLQKYAETWKANPENWRFLTGDTAEIQRVCDLFGVNYASNEGLFIHSIHTAVIDRKGKLVTNLEGNEFTSKQLADLVEAVLDHGKAPQ